MYAIRQFHARPESVEAVRFDGKNAREIVDWVRGSGSSARVDEAGSFVLGAGASEQLPLYGAVVVRDGAGRFSALSLGEFEARYEASEPVLVG